jgi:hypothetical protein
MANSVGEDTFSSAPFMSASREFSRDMLGLNLYLKMAKRSGPAFTTARDLHPDRDMAHHRNKAKASR